MREHRKWKQNWMLLCLGVLMFSASGAWADFTFGEPVNLGAPVNTTMHEGTPMISLDGLSLYFMGGDPDSGGDIMVAKRKSTKDTWEPPTNLGPIVNSSWYEAGPYISADGLTLYFDSDRPGGFGELDIWVTTRPTLDGDWTPPVNLGAPINNGQPTLSPCISTNGLELYFARFAVPNYPNRLYVSRRASVQDAWSEPVYLRELWYDGPNQNPSISADGLVLFFNSWCSGGYGKSDIYMTTRNTLDADWSPPVNIGPTVNSSYAEYGPRVSSDGRTLYFSHFANYDAWIQPGGIGGADIWQASIDPIMDFNGDGLVDSADVAIMNGRLGTDDSVCDIGPMPWGDGVVDERDLAILNEYIAPVAHWAFDETEGSFAYDSAGVNDAFVIGGAEWQPQGGHINGALQLDGVDDCAIAGPVLNPADDPFSVFAWINGGQPGQVLISQQGASDWLAVDAEGHLMTELKATGSSEGPLHSPSNITDGLWHRVGVIWDGTNRILYVDDVQVAKDTQDGLESSNNGLYIGTGKMMAPGTYFSGLIDDIRIYKGVITP